MSNGNKYIPPTLDVDGFHCPHCETFAHQKFYNMYYYDGGSHRYLNHSKTSFCSRCSDFAIWYDKKMIYPISSSAPMPSEDMPDDVKEDFLEARNIINYSPRAAAALIRLGLQKLMLHLGESGKNINKDIAGLVKKGLPKKIQKALDGVRVIGNNAVHPGVIDIKDDIETTINLFELLNMIIDVMITQPKKVDEIFDKIPEDAKKAIEKRDKNI